MSPEKKQRYQDQIDEDGPYEIGIHPLQIILDLSEKGYDQTKFGKEMNKSQAAINQVIHRKSSSVDIRDRISDILGKSFEEVWGMTKEESMSKRKTTTNIN